MLLEYGSRNHRSEEQLTALDRVIVLLQKINISMLTYHYARVARHTYTQISHGEGPPPRPGESRE